jgi:hypothetical protein
MIPKPSVTSLKSEVSAIERTSSEETITLKITVCPKLEKSSGHEHYSMTSVNGGEDRLGTFSGDSDPLSEKKFSRVREVLEMAYWQTWECYGKPFVSFEKGNRID